MATDRPWFPFYAKDWLDYRVLRMPLAAQGAYIRLLAHMWADSPDNCSLPNNPKDLARLLSISEKKRKSIFEKLMCENDPIFLVEGDRIVSQRLRQEAEKSLQKSEKARESALARHHANAMRTQCEQDALHSHSHSYIKKPPLPPLKKSPMTKHGLVKTDQQREAIARDVVVAYLECVSKAGNPDPAERSVVRMLKAGSTADDLWGMVCNCAEYWESTSCDPRFKNEVHNFFGQKQGCKNAKWWPEVISPDEPKKKTIWDQPFYDDLTPEERKERYGV